MNRAGLSDDKSRKFGFRLQYFVGVSCILCTVVS